MEVEARIDPEDGRAYTLEDMTELYGHMFTKKAIKKYWDLRCTAVEAPRPDGEHKGRSRARARAKASAAGGEASAHTEAEPEASEEAPASEGKERRADVARALSQTMAARERDWRIGPVVYQVFVDRFAPPADLEAKRHLYPAPCTLHTWSELPQPGVLNEETKYYTHELQFWGGDLKGLRSKMDYVKGLGADVLYLQPIVEAFSNHKYDTTDYLRVDPQYGTMEDFHDLAAAVHGSGMRLVLDGVFNHIGARSQAVKEALEDKSSERRSWFFLGDEYKLGYKVWGCAANLLELKLEARSLQKYLWKGKKSVVAHWLDAGADGWRLDVASELGFANLMAITRAAHRHKTSSLVVGEVWAYPPQWTSSMDGVLSLHLGVLVYGLLDGSCPGPTAAQSVQRMIEDSSTEEVLRSWIVVSNHDMPRLASRLPEVRLRKLAQVLQFTWPGAPLVYYGDELGLAGSDDPHNRAPMPWGAAEEAGDGLLEHTRMLAAMRKRLRALRIGDYRALIAQRLMAFVRTTDKVIDVVVVMVNPTDDPVKEMVVVPVPSILGHTLFRDELSGEEVRALGSTFAMEVPAKSARILAMVDESGNPSGDQYKRMYGHPATFKHIQP
mmetsp:Transcript_73552/g.227156  ORF Transcript_73552/g.227156 Transcript_73552/m.227156 type:complete len:611 (+) Transcript_73552:56-1888(+)